MLDVAPAGFVVSRLAVSCPSRSVVPSIPGGGVSQGRSVRRNRWQASVSGTRADAAGFVVSIRWMEHHVTLALQRPSPTRRTAVSSVARVRPSAPVCCRVPMPFQSVVLSREGTVPLLHCPDWPMLFLPKGTNSIDCPNLQRRQGEVPRPFQQVLSGLPRVVASSARALSPAACWRTSVQRWPCSLQLSLGPAFAGFRDRAGPYDGSATSTTHSLVQNVKEQIERCVSSVSPPVDPAVGQLQCRRRASFSQTVSGDSRRPGWADMIPGTRTFAGPGCRGPTRKRDDRRIYSMTGNLLLIEHPIAR